LRRALTKKQIAGVTVDLDDEAYLTHHAQWNREVAAALAKEEGPLEGPRVYRQGFQGKGVLPGMRRMNKVGGVPTKDLYALFPGGPIKKAAKIAGYPKPVS